MIVSRPKAEEAATVLGVELQGLTPNAMRKAYRAKAKECHPDHHKDKLQQWARISWAKNCLEHWLKRNPTPEAPSEIQGKGDCRACKGTGRVPITNRGFGKPLTVQCVICKGLGTVLPEENDHD